jgi:hypothetical protein
MLGQLVFEVALAFHYREFAPDSHSARARGLVPPGLSQAVDGRISQVAGGAETPRQPPLNSLERGFAGVDGYRPTRIRPRQLNSPYIPEPPQESKRPPVGWGDGKPLCLRNEERPQVEDGWNVQFVKGRRQRHVRPWSGQRGDQNNLE